MARTRGLRLAQGRRSRRGALVVGAALAGAPVAMAQTYRPIDLGSLYGWAEARAVNDAQVVVGSTVGDRWEYRGLLWNGEFSSVDPSSSATQAEGMDVNARARAIFAVYSMGEVSARALLLDQHGAPFDLGDFCPRAINKAGGVVGGQDAVDPGTGLVVTQAVLWNKHALVPLEQLDGGVSSTALDVSNNGAIVGSAIAAGSLQPTAVFWRRGAIRDLGTLGATPAQATCVSPNGKFVAGFSATASAPMHAFRFKVTRRGVVTQRRDLGTLEAGGWSVGYDATNGGRVVGTSDGRAFLFARGRMIDLNDTISAALGWTLIGATGINANGDIVGWGDHGPLGIRAFLLVPTCSKADVAAPFGVLDAGDRDFYLSQYNAGNISEADLTGTSVPGSPGYGVPDGMLTSDDLMYFLALYAAGC